MITARCMPMSVRSLPRQRRILNTALQDKWRVLEVDASLHQKFEQYQILSHICFIRVTTGITPSGVFFPLRMFRGWPSVGTHFDAANLDRLNIDGPLHFQTGVLFETLQAFSWSGLRSPPCLSPKVLRHTDAQTEAIDVWSAGMTFMELFTGCTTLRVDDQTGLSHVASAPALELRTLGGSRSPLPS